MVRVGSDGKDSAPVILGKIDALQVRILNLWFTAIARGNAPTTTTAPSTSASSGTATADLGGTVAMLHPTGAECRDGSVGNVRLKR